MKRLLICLLCLTMLLVGCSSNDTPDETDAATNEPTVETTGGQDETVEKIPAISTSTPLFKICYGVAENLGHAEYIQQILESKTNIRFDLVDAYSKVGDSKAIYVGLVDGNDAQNAVYNENITYNGYGAVYSDGNIYICGYNYDMVGKAAKKFVSEMLKDYVTTIDGKVDAYFTTSMMFVSNPAYSIKDAKLLGTDISDYRIVISASAEDTFKEMVALSRAEIGKSTGAYLEIVDDSTEAEENEIVIGDTSRATSDVLTAELDMLEYQIKSSGKSIAVGVGGHIAMYSAFIDLATLSSTDTASGISKETDASDSFMKDQPLAKAEDATIRVISANILGGSDNGGNGTCTRKLRMELVSEYLIAYSPDSVGLQEYIGSNKTYLEPLISEKYATVEFDEFGAPWVSTIYLKDKYQVGDKNCINIKVDGDGEDQDYYFTWVELENMNGRTAYIHANLHLDYRTDALRIEQAEMIQAEIANIFAKYDDEIFVMTGDYNAKIDSDAATFEALIGSYSISDAAEEAPEGKADLKNNSSHNVCEIGNPVVGNDRTIDHILVNNFTTEVHLHKVVYDSLNCHSSDHYPILIDISVKS